MPFGASGTTVDCTPGTQRGVTAALLIERDERLVAQAVVRRVSRGWILYESSMNAWCFTVDGLWSAMPNSIVELSNAPTMKSAIAFPVRVPWKFADRGRAPD